MNKLAGSTSPYLLQHVENPVAWEPWGPEALERSRREGKPIFLSVGYSACHWCHVMAHESFESDSLAAVLNPNFVCIKVDREERPDIDAVYMAAVQLLTGRGGWPMSVFLTPDLEPFFAGTYWPPAPRHGMPGFAQVLEAVLEAWRERRDTVVEQAAEITRAIARQAGPAAGPGPALSADLLEHAAASLARSFDAEHGGFGGAPKFPHPMDLRLLLRTARHSGRTRDVEMGAHTLERMAAGGMHDQLGGGFARYSVDDRWLVPHFEKMLYDNALLAVAYLEAFLVTGRADFAAVVRSTLDYVLRDMTDPAGGFWSAEDADSEGEEGKFYVWTQDEIRAELGPEDADLVCTAYDVTPRGNFEGRSILNLPRPLAEVAAARGVPLADLERRLAAARDKLLVARGRRVRPGTDDKVLVAWNGLMIDALARAGTVLGEERYVAAAARAADFLLAECRTSAGDLAHQWRRGVAGGLAFADDLACLAEGLVSLYEASFAEPWIAAACALADRLVGADESGPLAGGGFIDPDSGAFFQASAAHERLIVRRPDLLDNAVPGSNGMAATALLRLAALTGRERYREAAERALAAAAPLMERAPGAVPQALLALDVMLGPGEEFVIVGAGGGRTAEVLAAIRGRFRPHAVVAARAPDGLAAPGPLAALFAGRTGAAADVVLYRCRGRACAAPVIGAVAVAAAGEP
ncbi:MAG: thioredoxin domain-containing protein [Planctomycetaceae bacterium]